MGELDLKELIEFENGNEYYVINRTLHKKDFYILLMNKADSEDILIQKEVLLDGELKLQGVGSEENFNEVLTKFSKLIDNRS